MFSNGVVIVECCVARLLLDVYDDRNLHCFSEFFCCKNSVMFFLCECSCGSCLIVIWSCVFVMCVCDIIVD